MRQPRYAWPRVRWSCWEEGGKNEGEECDIKGGEKKGEKGERSNIRTAS